jgi:cysteinyl-tRNA synthetase
MSLRIHNTLSRASEEFVPLEHGHVRMYVCGITVYDLCHVGHARANVAFDVVQRWLKTSGYAVTFVRNITDIDDKIIRRAVENGETVRALTDRMIVEMYRDFDALGIERPTHDPRATDYVPQMLDIVQTLEDKGLAYVTASGDVNFSVRKFPGYGKLSGKSIDELHAGERVAVLEGKDDPLDFVLWKAAKDSEPEDAKWDSDALGFGFGKGRPGWHIECSAMACTLLGETFDIHGGGADLQFPHHENEIAQSEGANGVPLAKVWMHNGFVNIDNEKMSKSLGNFFTVREVLKKYQPETLRFFIVRAHYRSPLNYSDVHLDDAQGSLKRLYTALSLVPPVEMAVDWTKPFATRFKAAMDEDFATPEAVAVLFELASEVNKFKDGALAGLLKTLGGYLGLLQLPPDEYLQWRPPMVVKAVAGNAIAAGVAAQIIQTGLGNESIAELITQRATAKAAKNFAEADRIRKQLLENGIVLKDTPTGTTWESQ